MKKRSFVFASGITLGARQKQKHRFFFRAFLEIILSDFDGSNANSECRQVVKSSCETCPEKGIGK
jgi:hypothetical protein